MSFHKQLSYKIFISSKQIPPCSFAINPFIPVLVPDLTSVPIDLLSEHHINGIIQYAAFCVQTLSLSIKLVRFIILLEVPPVHSFLLLNNIPFVDVPQFICLSVEEPLGCFHIGAIIYNAPINMYRSFCQQKVLVLLNQRVGFMGHSLRVYLTKNKTKQNQIHYIPIRNTWECPSDSHSSLKHLVFSGFSFSHSSKCAVLFHYGLIWISIVTNDLKHISHTYQHPYLG